MKRALLIMLVLAAGFAAGVGFQRWSRSNGTGDAAAKGGRKILYWHDPMHPAYRSDKPGIAPDCGMKLEPVYADGGPAEMPAGDRKILHYRDPEDPNYRSDKPGLNPETGNDLEPVYEGDAASMPPGTVQISSEKQQLIGVKFGHVELQTAGRAIRAVGRVSVDETRIAHVHTRVEGWIDRVMVDFTGEMVKQGQPLVTIYSPELLATQQELLLALKAREILRESPLKAVHDDNDSLVAVARKRLELWGLAGEQIEQVVRTGKPLTNITVHSPITGYVTARNAFIRQKITPETELYTIVDLSRVWIMADVFESDAGLVRLGQNATVTLSYLNRPPIQAKVTYIQPQVDAQTRTMRVRLEMPNPGNEIKPEMYANVDLHVSSRERLVVPVNSVLNSGLRQTVFVDRGNGFLEPRQVETGERMGDRIEILRGLTAGERVAASGVFLIDSESQLKSAASGMGAHQHGGAPAAGAGNGGLEPAAPAARPQRSPQEDAPAQPPPPAGTHQHD